MFEMLTGVVIVANVDVHRNLHGGLVNVLMNYEVDVLI
jgi:hypothetical protein